MHDAGDVALWRMEDEMIMVPHQGIHVTFRAESLERDAYDLQELSTIPGIDEDHLLPIASRHHVIDRTTKDDSMLCRHALAGANGGHFAVVSIFEGIRVRAF
jgi:hypothetical protein